MPKAPKAPRMAPPVLATDPLAVQAVGLTPTAAPVDESASPVDPESATGAARNRNTGKPKQIQHIILPDGREKRYNEAKLDCPSGPETCEIREIMRIAIGNGAFETRLVKVVGPQVAEIQPYAPLKHTDNHCLHISRLQADRLTCGVCGRVSSNQFNAYSHVICQRKHYRCVVCDIGCTTLAGFQKHCRTTQTHQHLMDEWKVSKANPIAYVPAEYWGMGVADTEAYQQPAVTHSLDSLAAFALLDYQTNSPVEAGDEKKGEVKVKPEDAKPELPDSPESPEPVDGEGYMDEEVELDEGTVYPYQLVQSLLPLEEPIQYEENGMPGQTLSKDDRIKDFVERYEEYATELVL